MDDREIRIYQMFVRVRDFVSENSSDFPAQSLGGEKFTVLEQVIADLDRHSTDEASRASAARAHTGIKREAKAALKELMDAISATARRMAQSPGGASMPGDFRVPHSNGDQALLNAARGFVADATPLKSEFVKWGLPVTFLDDLNAAIERFEEAVNNRNVSTSRRVEATAGIDEAIKRGKQAVSDLDRIARNKYRADAAKLAAWESASHTERAPRAATKRSTPSAPAAT